MIEFVTTSETSARMSDKWLAPPACAIENARHGNSYRISPAKVRHHNGSNGSNGSKSSGPNGSGQRVSMKTADVRAVARLAPYPDVVLGIGSGMLIGAILACRFSLCRT